ncbi:unnamed protein product [Paramecium sonneborni]|uniref:Uncharacterized protein n=1 Tax=Paramecium sonneborni TaxID=65129 RepID=A0A8S1PX47_9CILI|nr:unnamed protein product [Paramecium sonneborni]CAD8107726.1 unnamed protein product [Paramecium sonneborni]
MITNRSQKKLLNYSPLPIAKSESLLKDISRLDEQISFFNSYIQKQKTDKIKRKIPFQCSTPLRIQALKLNLSFNKTKQNKSLLNRKQIANEQSHLITGKKTQQNEEKFSRTKNSISRWEEQIDQSESFFLYHF